MDILISINVIVLKTMEMLTLSSHPWLHLRKDIMYHSPAGCDSEWAPIIKRPVGRCTYVHTLSYALFNLHSAIVFLVLQMTMAANVINYQWIIGSGALAVLLVLLVFLLQF